MSVTCLGLRQLIRDSLPQGQATCPGPFSQDSGTCKAKGWEQGWAEGTSAEAVARIAQHAGYIHSTLPGLRGLTGSSFTSGLVSEWLSPSPAHPNPYATSPPDHGLPTGHRAWAPLWAQHPDKACRSWWWPSSEWQRLVCPFARTHPLNVTGISR